MIKYTKGIFIWNKKRTDSPSNIKQIEKCLLTCQIWRSLCKVGLTNMNISYRKKYDGKTDSRLLITAVRGNSIDFDILQTAAEVAPLFATGLDFLKAILPAIEYLLGDKTKDVPTKTEVKNIQNIITPSINGGVSEIHVRGNGNTVNININYNDANKINNTAEDMLISEDIKSTEHYIKRHLRFYQARDAKSKTGNQSIAS